jgi:hypothetical protein
MKRSFVAGILVITAFALAMGYLEAVVVLYLRGTLGIALTQPNTQIIISGRTLLIEQLREVMTIIMLASVGWLYGRRLRERFAAFIWCFAIWDIIYYVSSHFLISWPLSLTDIDMLFLLPVPWIAPVIVPVVIFSIALIVSGYVLFKESKY